MNRVQWYVVAAVLAGCGGSPSAMSNDAGIGGDGQVTQSLEVCGDEQLGPNEVCDDGNQTDGDGCSANCKSNERCGNGVIDTTVQEICDDSNTVGGDGCSADCKSKETCGNGIVDLAANEVCDDGNTASGDTCSADCRTCTSGTCQPDVTTTAFRVKTLKLVDPHIFMNLCLGKCQCKDVTDSSAVLFSVNGSIQDNLNKYTINYVELFKPLDITLTSTPMDFVDGTCSAGSPPACRSKANGMTYPTTAEQKAAGATCYTADAATVNATYPKANVVAGPCFVTGPKSIEVTVTGVQIPLQDARISATFANGLPPTSLVSGVISGFLPAADAKKIVLTDIGGDSLYKHLAAAPDSAASCATHSDLDTYKGVQGFWFYLNFTAERATYTAP